MTAKLAAPFLVMTSSYEAVISLTGNFFKDAPKGRNYNSESFNVLVNDAPKGRNYNSESFNVLVKAVWE